MEFKYGDHPIDPYYRWGPQSQNIEFTSPKSDPPRRPRRMQSASQIPFRSTIAGPGPVQYTQPANHVNTLPRNFLQPVPKQVKKKRNEELLEGFLPPPFAPSQPRRHASYANLPIMDRWNAVPAPAAVYFPPPVATNLDFGHSSFTASRIPLGPTDHHSSNYEYHYQVNGPTGSSVFRSPETSTDAFASVPPKTSGNARVTRVVKKKFEFGSYVLVRADRDSVWRVGNYVCTTKHRDSNGEKYYLYKADVTYDLKTNESSEGYYNADNIIQIPEDDTPHITPSHPEALRLQRLVREPVSNNTFLFAAIPTKAFCPLSVKTIYTESWKPVMCLGEVLPNYGYSVRVVAGEDLGKQFVIYKVKPFVGSNSI